MELLVSVTSRREALEAIRGGAHIIDVKNPREDLLALTFQESSDKLEKLRQLTLE